MISLIMIETTSRGSFNHDQEKWRTCGEEASAQKLQIWAFYQAKCLFTMWANKAIQYDLSVTDRKQNIWQNIATKVYDGGYKRVALQNCN